LHIPNDFIKRLEMNFFQMKLAPNFLAKNYSDLSPGTKKKLLLAVLFATEPEFILADEITNHLDREAIEVVIGWMKKSTSAMLLVDHNSEFLNVVSNHYLFLPNNLERKIINLPNLNFDEALQALDELAEKQKIEQQAVFRRKEQLENQVKLLQRRAKVFDADVKGAMSATKTKLQKEVFENPLIGELDLRKKVSFATRQNPDKIKKNLLISVTDLEFLIGLNLTQKISEFKLYEGQKIRINGANGKGKSTLLKLITQLINHENIQNDPQYLDGQVEIFNLQSKQFFALKQVTNYPINFTIESYLQLYTEMMGYEINGFLKKIELQKFDGNSHLGNLSMGEFIRLQLGILAKVQHQLKLLILDEPGNFLDIFTQHALVKLLNSYTGSLLIVTHDQNLADKIELSEEFVVS
jgi:ATPase subunit of ABC transporter with duplicated ATPase domains